MWLVPSRHVETTEAGLSPTFRGSALRRWCVSEAEHSCTCALSHGDPLTDGRSVECVQRRRLRFIEGIAGLVAQQAPSHEQAQDARSNDTEEGLDFLVGGRFGGCEGKRAVRLSHEDPVDRQRVEVHVQVQRAAKALDDRDRTGTAASVTRARERSQPIGTTVGTAKPGKPMRKHAAADESLKLALHEQGGATHVRAGSRLARSCGVKLHNDSASSRLVSWLATAFSTFSRETAVKRSGGSSPTAGASCRGFHKVWRPFPFSNRSS
jgi:hypothetical protein